MRGGRCCSATSRCTTPTASGSSRARMSSLQRRQDRQRRRQRCPSCPPGRASSTARARRSCPGLWDSHMHVGDDFQTVSEVALGVTSCRNPGGPIELEVRSASAATHGTLLAPECFNSVIVDQKGPLAAQGSLAVSQPRGDARRGSQDQGERPDRRQILHVDEAGVDRARRRSWRTSWACTSTATSRRACARSTRSTPAMTRSPTSISRPCRRCREEVVAKSNTTMRMLGPGKYFKDVDLNAEPTKTVITTMAREADRARSDAGGGRGRAARRTRATSRRPTRLMSGTLPAATERGFKSGPIPTCPRA